MNSNRSDTTDWRRENTEHLSSYKPEENTDEEFSCILPSSPNWYCNSILSCLNGFSAFGGKNAVFIFDMKQKPPLCEWNMSGTTFALKITAVALICTDEHSSDTVDYLAFGSEDGLLKIVDIKSKAVIKDLRKHTAKITTLSWSPQRKETLVSGDEKGVILIWNYNEKICNIWTPIVSTITCMELSPHVPDIVIVGYINGNIIVGDTKKSLVLHTFKNHINEICSLSWHPFKTGQDLFVSGSKDKTIRVFNYAEQTNVKTYTSPRNIGSNKNSYQAPKTKVYVAVLWLNEEQIVSGYQSGDLLLWDTQSGKWNALSNGHNRIVFTLCRDFLTDYFISISMDRTMIFHNAATLKVAYKVPTFGGFIYSLSNTPHDPHRLAAGVGDNTIRVWSTGNKNKPYASNAIWHGIKTKVTMIQCHPTKEGIVGFGTEDGHVGCYSSISQKSDVSVTYHKKTVYALSWGPCCSKEDTEESPARVNCLFSAGGEGCILMHKMGAFNQQAVDIGKFIKDTNNISPVPLRSEIKWHHSFAFVAIGNEDGTVDIFASTKLTHIGRIQVHKKMINSLDWHHNFSADSISFSFWIASGSNEDTVNVVDVSSICLPEEEDPSTNKVITIDTPYQMLVGHNGRITNVAWSPHTNGILASSSYDGSVQIWDVKNNEMLANYRGHMGRVHCVAWSYVSSEVLFSGGEDFCLHRWKYSETVDKKPPTAAKSKTKSKSKKKKKDTLPHLVPMENEEVVTVNTSTALEVVDDIKRTNTVQSPQSKSVFDKVNTEQRSNEILQASTPATKLEVQFVDKGDTEKRKKRHMKTSLFKKSSVADAKKKELMQQDCILLATYLQAEQQKKGSGYEVSQIHPGSENHVNLGLYGTRKDTFRMLSTECAGHIETGHQENFTQLQLWQSNVPAAIEHAIKNSLLNESLVALSPLGNYDLWRSTCLAFGEQLEGRCNFHLAASYYVAMGDVHRALNMFRTNNMLKEAITLAKTQLSSDDRIINDIFGQWAKKLSDEFSYEHSAEW